ncbi:MAG: 50S ribosomal protein L25/general stress protein Ctc [Actinomycetaceae bacterium]|nr:50S ribosomal protein L25/general stress protein Ctc [Arcanobacterium sp.]MDD7505835.1 50S ribosomal protein L25/general stress protein Ctc [Actinomycetaceae bacterium]MDD7687419.1 50S ribosomal protein L25/general stress protein Ctc [Actinomycetaceae bacterium]MDY5272893.1 50S ribosomal protein L25/general stress protein Ctc [Arcanobacterium sp.]
MADAIKAEKRDAFGKGAARKLRAAGRTPAVVYGLGEDPAHITFDAHEIFMEVRSNANAVLTLEVGGKKQLALVKDVQINPLSREIEHVDLLRVKADQKVEVEVPLELTGVPFGQAIATLELLHLLVQAPATDIPEQIVINVEGLEDGTVLHVSDLELPADVIAEVDGEEVAVTVAVPREPEAEEEAASAPDEEAASEAAE